MRLVSWNVNGLRAAMNKGFKDFFNEIGSDIFAIQETKMQEDQKDFSFPGYHEYWNNAVKKGYSGTLVYTKSEPLSVVFGIGDKHNDEGRVTVLEYPEFYFVTAYVPNSQPELTRLPYRMEFDDDFRNYLISLDQKKPVIMCGDLNVAHEAIDIKNAKANERNAGFTIEERTKFSRLLAAGFTDSFRYLYPNTIKYTWWSYMFNSRANNVGWRIDYFVISDRLRPRLLDSRIQPEILGSDHCPVVLDLN